METGEILHALAEVTHPAREDRSIIDLGMVEDIVLEEGKIIVTLGFTGRQDPLKDYLAGAAKAAILRHDPSADVDVRTVVNEAPQKKQDIRDLTLDQLSEVRHIIGVASGKGGVGKSTVAVNLAIALARLGYRVGLADADVYGPSVPMMTGKKYGVKWLSIGYFARPGQALIWRGPMACNALKQMILQVKWGPLDFLLVDMPPGTGDIHISLVQEVPMEGAVIVTTPQAVALADVEKGIDMFRNKNIDRPVFGIVENMAWFTPEEHPSEKYYIFGRDGGATMAARFDVPLLGQIPLVQSIRESGDAGEPIALSSRPDAEAFLALAGTLAKILG